MPLYNDNRLPRELEQRIESEVRQGERLLWMGQPQPKRFARGAWPIVAFGIPWTLFALFWMAMASGMLFFGDGPEGGLAYIFPLFGLPFVLIGFAMLSSPYWLRRRAKNTCYALTDRRAILWEAGWRGSFEVRSYEPEELRKIHRVEYGDGSGDLIFEEAMRLGRDSDGDARMHTKRHGFMGIGRVREIEELLRKALLPDEVRVRE